MIYTLKIEDKEALLMRRALGLLPHDEVRGLIESVGAQLVEQDREANLPQPTVTPGS